MIKTILKHYIIDQVINAAIPSISANSQIKIVVAETSTYVRQMFITINNNIIAVRCTNTTIFISKLDEYSMDNIIEDFNRLNYTIYLRSEHQVTTLNDIQILLNQFHSNPPLSENNIELLNYYCGFN